MSVALSNTTYPLAAFDKSPLTKVKQVDYSGYKEIVVDGINYDKEQWSLSWIPMDSTTVIALETILLNSTKGTTFYILWTGPGESVAKYYIAQSINKTKIRPVKYKITATFERVFPLV